MLKFGHPVTYRIIDRGLLEQIGPTGIQGGGDKIDAGKLESYNITPGINV